MRPVAARARHSETAGLVFLFVFTLAAVIGYGIFGLNPGRLPSDGLSRRLYNVSFQLFAQAQILVALAILMIPMIRRCGWRLLAPFAVVYVLSFLSEHIGTGYGIPFGGYEYTGLLGARVGPRVPALIPVSWFLMSVPSWVLARAALGAGSRGSSRVLVGAAWLVAWDLALDPAMSALTPYWRWEGSGPYYGMPWMNLAGWYMTGVVLLGVLEGLSDWARLHALPTPWMAGFYGAMVLMPLGMLAAAGAWLAVMVTLVAMAALASVSVLRSSAAPVPDSVVA
jgi:uncharacterized membrane protein